MFNYGDSALTLLAPNSAQVCRLENALRLPFQHVEESAIAYRPADGFASPS